MRLRDALIRASGFAATKKSAPPAHKLVRVYPPVFDASEAGDWPVQPGWVVAYDGEVGLAIPVHPLDDARCLPVSLPAKETAVAMKGVPKTDHDWRVYAKSSQAICVETSAGAKTVLASREHDEDFLLHMPETSGAMAPVERLDLILSVLHASSAEAEKEELRCVHFHPQWVEATDENRVARVPMSAVTRPALVPAALFKKFPKRKRRIPPMMAFGDQCAFLVVDQEFRWTHIVDSDYFNLDPLLPKAHSGQSVVVNRSHFKEGVKAAMKSTVNQYVELRFGSELLTVSGLNPDRTHAYTQTFPARGSSDLVTSVFRGKLLWEAVHAVDDDVVALWYDTPNSPLRVEASNYVEAVWPMRAVEG